jgi:hypothetical protein
MFKPVTRFRPHARSTARFIRGLCLIALAATAACVDGSKTVLNEQAEAHRLSSHLRVEFTRATDASNRAVMADTDEASAAAAREAQQARQSVQHDVDALKKILGDLGDREEAGHLDRFIAGFDEYQKLDDTILPLAVENTNIKAQRLSFGAAQDAVDAFRQSIGAAAHLAPAKNAAVADAAAARAETAVLEIQVIQARHIAESDEAAMARMESTMKTSEATARKAVDTLKGLLQPATAAPSLTAAAEALNRLMTTNTEIVSLSRRNSNVRSLALSLGKKRTVTAECDASLQALEDTLAAHHFSATR